MIKNILIIISVLLFCVQCKREKDSISTHDIKGIVFNNCTDSGLTNVTVYLSDGQGLNQTAISDDKGNFIFPNINIHSSKKYNYRLNIPSKSGFGATTFENSGFNGDFVSFNSESVIDNFTLKVTPKYINFEIICIKSLSSNNNDSILFNTFNKNFHKNLPDNPYKWGGAMALAHIIMVRLIILWVNTS